MMNSNAIEGFAVSKLKTTLMLNDYLEPFINEGDKEPSWDGSVYLYNKKGKKKIDIKGRVSIQVKGEAEKDSSNNEIKYPVSVIDLKNYLTDGGVIYFVVYVDKQGDGKIYYCTMEPLRIKTFLSELRRPNQKTKSIPFRALPKDSNKVRDIFFNFQLNSQKQASFVNKAPLVFEDFADKCGEGQLEVSIQGYGLNNLSDFQEFKKYNNPFMYAKIPELDILVPLDGVITEIFQFEKTELSIGVGGKVYYETAIREFYGNEVHLRLSKWLTMTFNTHKKEFRIDIKSSPFFRTAAKDLSFFLNVLREGNVEVNGISTKLFKDKNSIDEYDYEDNAKRLDVYEGTIKLMDLLGIEEDIDMTKLSQEEINNLNMLRLALVNKCKLTGFKKKIETFKFVTIGKYKFAFIFDESRDEPGTYRVFDIFHTALYLKGEEANGEKYSLPVISILDAKDFAEITNINYEEIMIAFQEIPLKEPVLVQANFVVLSLVGAADIVDETDKNKRKRLLETALSFIEWIQEVDKENHWITEEILLLNKIQIRKRLGDLDKAEQRILLEMAENLKNSTELRFAAYTLLENKAEAGVQFEYLAEEKKKELSDYPIINLFQQLQ
ncbi:MULTISPECIES: hypothetical protein [Enterococcus]|uniref:hypothetical protein n=1 Tax=Enterococcus TaxID=1350 RepID=UPI00372D66CB